MIGSVAMRASRRVSACLPVCKLTYWGNQRINFLSPTKKEK